MQKEYDNIDIEHILDHPFLYIQIHQSRNLLRSSHFNTITAFSLDSSSLYDHCQAVIMYSVTHDLILTQFSFCRETNFKLFVKLYNKFKILCMVSTYFYL